MMDRARSGSVHLSRENRAWSSDHIRSSWVLILVVIDIELMGEHESGKIARDPLEVLTSTNFGSIGLSRARKLDLDHIWIPPRLMAL
jgi:hypothetical protein